MLIARKLRERGFFTTIVSNIETEPVDLDLARGLILSGSPDSITEEDSRRLPNWIWRRNLPTLGICYGMHLLVSFFGGAITTAKNREFGKAMETIDNSLTHQMKHIFPTQSPHQVWMSHGDHVERVPNEFHVIGKTDTGIVSAIAHKDRKIYGVQYHPELSHTKNGISLLERFATQACQLKPNWTQESIVSQAQQEIRTKVGAGRVILAVSGGVDSTVAAMLFKQTLHPQQLECVLIDTGLLRKNEANDVNALFQELNINLTIINASEHFFLSLKGVTNPEDKRKIIGRVFIEQFEAYARKRGNLTHLGQGTLYPDVIESSLGGHATKPIKSHHNVGGMPEKLALKLVEPFRLLFKDEVREIGRKLTIPEKVLMRHPFPGPGLAVRIPGEVTREKVDILKRADAIFTQALVEQHHYQKIWQAGAILLPVKTVGLMGDQRTYQYACVLRAVTSEDAMSAEVFQFPVSFLDEVARKIVTNVNGINRVLYDITSKPPATIEWE